MIDSPEYWRGLAIDELSRGNLLQACNFYGSVVHLASGDLKKQYQAERAELLKRLEKEQKGLYVRTMSQVSLLNSKLLDNKQSEVVSPELPDSPNFGHQ